MAWDLSDWLLFSSITISVLIILGMMTFAMLAQGCCDPCYRYFIAKQDDAALLEDYGTPGDEFDATI